MLIKKNNGQSMVEMVFVIAFLALFLTGSVILLTNSLGAKSKTIDRKKAAAMGEQVIEGLVEKQKNDQVNFWSDSYLGNGVINGTLTDYPNYFYSIKFVDNKADYHCYKIGETLCVDATIKIGWSGSDNFVTFSRFFSKNQ